MPGSSPNWVESISPTVSAASSRPPAARPPSSRHARKRAYPRAVAKPPLSAQRGRTERVAVEERLAVRPEPGLAHDRGATRVRRIEAERGVHAERVEHGRAQIRAERHLGRSLDEPAGERVAGVRVAPVGARRVDQGGVDRGALGRPGPSSATSRWRSVNPSRTSSSSSRRPSSTAHMHAAAVSGFVSDASAKRVPGPTGSSPRATRTPAYASSITPDRSTTQAAAPGTVPASTQARTRSSGDPIVDGR